ncbi:succinate dehydrogenase [ubiquinone] cytochrome b small subunit, mitochondrial isoform X1 [Plodia interpunctella]|uniref:succinate dehydrogenase [ubiquinone] cytochrome b small subunit, mitochondrial isoform X1 n=1 Tax=Plodia interpunctella TaxID=58824 RepID=UPI0023674F47|nr:succinate dehydrogenase [ubiquinone] cytochrome b small subunit, mitochondrial isoform X1 [Plodia interpunctella]
MALSMFLRSPAFTSRFQQQCMRLATQSHSHSSTPTIVPLKNIVTLDAKKSTPILNSVRAFRTSVVRSALHDEKPHDHAKLWVVEKATAAILVPLIPLALVLPNKLFDSVLAILITAHSFWGVEAMIVEYARVIVVGPVVPKVAMGFNYGITFLMLGGLFYLIFNDIGMCRSFWKIWRNMRKPADKRR